MKRKLALSAVSGLALALGGSAMADVDVWTAGPGLGAAIADDAYNGSLASMTGISIDVLRGDIIKDVNVTIGMSHSWIGDLTIKTVDPDSSAGRLKRSTVTPASGDQVTDENGLGGSRG